MIKESLPIKCLEAVILGLYLTNGSAGLERYPLSFRSVFGSNVHRHVVLVVSWNGIFGALGMSRRNAATIISLVFAVVVELLLVPTTHSGLSTITAANLGIVLSYCSLELYWRAATRGQEES